MEIHPGVLFTEPRGHRIGLFFVSLSIICLLGWVYFAVVLDGPHVLLVLGVAIGCSGIAESLPADRRRVAGGLRVVAVGILVGFLGLLAFAPDLVMG